MPEKNGNREEIMDTCFGACGFHSVFKAVFICAFVQAVFINVMRDIILSVEYREESVVKMTKRDYNKF